MSDGGPIALHLGSVDVHAPAGAIDAGKTLTIAQGAPEGFAAEGAASIAGGPYLLSTSEGEPNSPISVQLHYDPASLSDGSKPLLLHGFSLTHTWIPETTSVDPATDTATATLDTFSPIDWTDSGLYYVGLFDGNRSSAPNDCTSSPPSWIQDASLPNGHDVPLPMCFTTASDDTRAVLHMVNNRGYAMRISISGATFDLDKSKFSDSLESQAALAFAAVAPSGSPQTFILAPGSDARLAFDKPPDQPTAQKVTIDPSSDASAGAFASVAWSILATARDEVGLPVGFADCVFSAAYDVSDDRSVASALDQVHQCVNVAAANLSDDKRLILRKIGYALAELDVVYKVRDLRFDALFPALIDFTISGSGLVNEGISIGPYDIGPIAPGHQYSLQLTASGGTAPYKFHIYTGEVGGVSPPPWVSVTASGLLTLNPPTGDKTDYRIYVYAFDSSGQHSPFARDWVHFSTTEHEEWSGSSLGPMMVEATTVSCASEALCAAQGYARSSGSDAVWSQGASGSGTWTVDPNTAPFAFSISCRYPTSCVRALYNNGSDPLEYQLTSDPTEFSTWNTLATYAVSRLGSPFDTGNEAGNALACPDQNFCAGVGQDTQLTSDGVSTNYGVYVSSHPGQQGSSFGQDGSWSRVYTDPTYMMTISCPSTTFCAALDATGNLIVSSDPMAGASAWHANGSLSTFGISHISCASSSLCVVTDGTSVETSIDPGSAGPSWSVQQIAPNVIQDVDCPTMSFCAAVDQNGDLLVSDDPGDKPATWRTEHVPDASVILRGISCASDSFCALVGSQSIAGTSQPNAIGYIWKRPAA